MLLHDLLHQFDPSLPLNGVPDAPVAGVRDGSRLVRPGDLFVARAGTKADGGHFAADAVERGAIAVMTESKIAGLAVPQVVVPQAARAVSVLAHLFQGQPTETVKT